MHIFYAILLLYTRRKTQLLQKLEWHLDVDNNMANKNIYANYYGNTYSKFLAAYPTHSIHFIKKDYPVTVL